MKFLPTFFLSSLCLLSTIVFAQPSNDDCVNAIELIPDSTMSYQYFSFDNATRDLSLGLLPPTYEDVFFKFTATDYMHNIIVNATNSVNWMSVGLIVMEGDCINGFTSVSGINFPEQYPSPEGVCRFDGFNPGTEYYILLSNVSTSNMGDFEILITRASIEGEWCYNAEDIASGVTYSGSNFFSSQEGEDFEISPGEICAITLENGYWYSYVAQESGIHDFIFDNMMYIGGEGSNVGRGHQIGILESVNGDCSSVTSIACDSSEFYYAGFSLNLTQGYTYFIIVEGDAGCLVSYDFTMTAPTSNVSINEISEDNFTLYPTNPDNNVVIQFPNDNNYTVNIITSTGEYMLVERSTNSKKISIDVNGWHKGIYFVQIYNDKEFKTLKFVK